MGVHFRVAELAKLYGLNSDTLRYYEEQGLLHPRRGENRYREYSIADLCTLNVIRSLRELGVSVEEIRGYLGERSVAGTQKMLAGQQEIIREKVAALEEELRTVERRRERLNRAMARPVGEAALLAFPERPCVMLREEAPEPELDYLLKRLEQQNRQLLKDLGSRWMGAVIDARSLAQGRYDRYGAVFFLCDRSGEGNEFLPGGRYLSLVHAGGYGGIGESYRALYAAAEARGLTPLDTPLELYLVDVHDTVTEAEYRTELQLRVG